MKRAIVAGATSHGLGITRLLLSKGYQVQLVDQQEAVLASARADLADLLRKTGGQRVGELRTSGAPSEVDSPDLAVETGTGTVAEKRAALAALEAVVPPSALLITSSPLVSVSSVAVGAQEPARVIGLNIPGVSEETQVAEVVAGQKSDEAVIDRMFKIVKSWGKTPVRVADSPGLIVDRILCSYYLEAQRVLADGIGGVDEIDGIMRTYGRFKLGPFEAMDSVGLDLDLVLTTSIWERLGRPRRLQPHAAQRKLVERGFTGRGSGRGFYLHDSDGVLPAWIVDRRSFELSPLHSDAMVTFAARAGAINAAGTEQYIFSRILAAVINEAGWVFEESVASPRDIDFAMVLGADFPQGPLAWSDDIGHRTIRGFLHGAAGVVGDDRYQPAPLFERAT